MRAGPLRPVAGRRMRVKWMRKLRSSQEGYIYLLFGICWLAYSTSYIGRLNFSAAMPDIIASTGISKSVIGVVGSAFFLSYCAGQLLNGFIGDKVRPHVMIATGMTGSGLCNLAMGFAGGVGSMTVIWCLNGFLQSMIWSPIVRTIGEWFPNDYRKKAAANIQTTTAVGTLAAYALTSLLLLLAGWRAAFFAASLLVAVVGVFVFFAMRGVEARHREDRDRLFAADALAETGGREKDVQQGKAPFFSLVISAGLLVMAVPIIANGIIKDGVVMWVPTFVSESFGLSSSLSVLLTMVLPVVNLSGVYLATWLNRRLRNELMTSAVLFGVCLASLALMAFFPDKSVWLSLASLGVTTSAMLGINTMLTGVVPIYFAKYGRASSVTGFLNAFVYVGSGVSGMGIGAVAQRFGWSVTVWAWVGVVFVGLAVCLLAAAKWRRYLRAENA